MSCVQIHVPCQAVFAKAPQKPSLCTTIPKFQSHDPLSNSLAFPQGFVVADQAFPRGQCRASVIGHLRQVLRWVRHTSTTLLIVNKSAPTLFKAARRLLLRIYDTHFRWKGWKLLHLMWRKLSPNSWSSTIFQVQRCSMYTHTHAHTHTQNARALVMFGNTFGNMLIRVPPPHHLKPIYFCTLYNLL